MLNVELVVKRTIHIQQFDDYWSGRKGIAESYFQRCLEIPWPLELCGDEVVPFLHYIWDLPEDLKKIDLSLHDQPSEDREKLEVKEATEVYSDGERYPVLYHGKSGFVFEHDPLDKVLKPFVGRFVYLQVEYDA